MAVAAWTVNVLAGCEPSRRGLHQPAAGADVDVHVGEMALHGLPVGDRPAEGDRRRAKAVDSSSARCASPTMQFDSETRL